MNGKKTYAVAIGGILAAVAGYLTGELNPGNAALQTHGASVNLDPERRFGTRQAVFRYVGASADQTAAKSRANALAAELDALSVSGAPAVMVSNRVAIWLSGGNGNPADVELAQYFVDKLAVRAESLASPLTPEMQRVLSVYAAAIRGALLDADG